MPDIVSWHSLPGDPVANVAAANATLDPRGIAHPRPYQINEYGATDEQNPADGAWYVARLERARADGLRANWAGGRQPATTWATCWSATRPASTSPRAKWWAYRYYASQTGQAVSVTASQSYDAYATQATGAARGPRRWRTTTGNLTVNLQRLDTTSGIVQNNQVRVLTQRIPHSGGGAVQGVTVSNSVVNVANNNVAVTLPYGNQTDTYTVTLLPPSDAGLQSVAVAQHPSSAWTTRGWAPPTATPSSSTTAMVTSNSGTSGRSTGWLNTYTVVNQRQRQVSGRQRGRPPPTARPCSSGPARTASASSSPSPQGDLRGNDSHDCNSSMARHSGKCVDVNGVSTAARARILQWIRAQAHRPEQPVPNQDLAALKPVAPSAGMVPAGTRPPSRWPGRRGDEPLQALLYRFVRDPVEPIRHHHPGGSARSPPTNQGALRANPVPRPDPDESANPYRGGAARRRRLAVLVGALAGLLVVAGATPAVTCSPVAEASRVRAGRHRAGAERHDRRAASPAAASRSPTPAPPTAPRPNCGTARAAPPRRWT